MADLRADFAVLGEQCGDFALQCSDVAGFISQVSQRIEADHLKLDALRQGVSTLRRVQDEANRATADIREVSARATGLIDESQDSITEALEDIGRLIDDVVRMGDELAGFADAIEHVATISGRLDGIARQTGMIAINASIEAARAGTAASGFAAVASEVKRLATSAREATGLVGGSISTLETRARKVIEDLRAGAERGRGVRSRTGEINGTLASIARMVSQFERRTDAIEMAGMDVTAHVGRIDAGLDGFITTGRANAAQLGDMRERLDALETASNRMLDRVAHSGVETPDTPFIALARAGADRVRAAIEAALAAGEIDAEQLFDTAYRAVPDTDPPQFLTGLVPFADRRLRPLLDAATAEDNAIVGCCLVDRNGHLPTHISSRSEPQRPGERAWNLEHARNRQIFMDRQTRDALDRDGDWFLSTYRQDLGDGRYRALRSVFLPLNFGGRRWGLYELGYLI